MWEVKRRFSGDLDNLVLFRSVKEFGSGSTYFEQWFFADSPSWKGVRVKDKKILEYAGTVSRGQGVNLGNYYFLGMILQDKMYQNRSALVNGVIITQSLRRKYFEKSRSLIRRESEKIQKIRVGENMPEIILTMLAETEGKIQETARILKLPLIESKVA
tara:strand:- start:1445 stop:1921 length:477 start_codon:yes stop_codon:yes gene_type:complete